MKKTLVFIGAFLFAVPAFSGGIKNDDQGLNLACDGCVGASDIAAGAVGTSELEDGAAALVDLNTTNVDTRYLTTGTAQTITANKVFSADFTATASTPTVSSMTVTNQVNSASFQIGTNNLTTIEFGNLDGQDQGVKTTSSPQFAGLTLVGTSTATKVYSSTYSSITCNTGGTSTALGTTDNKIRRFDVCTTVGTDITMSSTAANGNVFTVNTPGVYAIYYSDRSTAAANFGVSLNCAALTTAIQTLTPAQGRIAMDTAAANHSANSPITLRLSAGDVIRPHTDGSADNATDIVMFRIERVY